MIFSEAFYFYYNSICRFCPIFILLHIILLYFFRGRRRSDVSKRTYTEDELQAALADIQSGKLGTRRAAVIYGIPRSTLRNKVRIPKDFIVILNFFRIQKLLELKY